MSATQPLPGVPWYDIDDPSSPALDELARRFALHELQVEDCRHRPQRAKTEEHDHYIFTVLKVLHANETVSFDDLDFFLGRDFLVTVHKGSNGIIEKVRRRAEEGDRARLDRLVYLLSDTVVDEYLPVLDRISDEISAIEARVLHHPDPAMLRRILRMKRRLVEFRRIMAGMREVMNTLTRRAGGLLGDDLDPYWRDVYDHLVRTLDLIESHRDLLTGSLDIYLSAVAHRTNETMKVLTIYGTLSLPLVIITGFFGMNLHLPWEETRYGVLYASAVMVAAAGTAFWYFRRRGIF